MFIPPVPLIRRNRIIYCLRKARAISEETAKPLDEIGLVNPYGFPMITKIMLRQEIIGKTEDGKYYLKI